MQLLMQVQHVGHEEQLGAKLWLQLQTLLERMQLFHETRENIDLQILRST